MMGFDEKLEAFDEINNADIHWDDANPAEHAYPAILRRYLKGKSSKNMYTLARIHSEIFEQLKLLLPHRIIVVMVREDAVHGNYNRDPFNYQHFNLAEFSLKVGSEKIPLPKLIILWDSKLPSIVSKLKLLSSTMLAPQL